MKQLLITNLILLEGNKPLLEDQENYQFHIEGDKICIEWTSLNERKNTYCETYSH